MIRENLVRKEVEESRRVAWLGDVIVASPLSLKIFSTIAFFLVLLGVALLFIGSFTEKVHVSGVLQPSAGLIEVASPRPGIVIEQRVKEGEYVRAGEVLFVVSSELAHADGSVARGSSTEGLTMVERKRSLVAAQVRANEELEEMENHKWRRSVSVMGQELLHLKKETALQRNQVAIAEEAHATYKKMRADGFISELGLSKSRSELLSQQARLAALEREEVRLQRDLENTRSEATLQRRKVASERLGFELELASIKGEEIDLRTASRLAIIAQTAGHVSSITVHPGQHTAGKSLATIIPATARLEGVAWIKSDLAPFLDRGQSVMLRFMAFPYQKYGQLDGTILEVTKSEAAEAASGTESHVRQSSGPSAYRMRIELSQQTISAFGRNIPLSSGLHFEGTVPIGKKRLYQLFIPQVARAQIN